MKTLEITKKTFSAITILTLSLTAMCPNGLILAQQTSATTDSRSQADEQAYQADVQALSQAQQLDKDISSCLSAYQWASPSDAAQGAAQAAGSVPGITPTPTQTPSSGNEGNSGSTENQHVDDNAQADPRNDFETDLGWDEFPDLDSYADYLDQTYYGDDSAATRTALKSATKASSRGTSGGGDIPNFLRQIKSLGGNVQDLSSSYNKVDDLVKDLGKIKNIKDFNNVLKEIKGVGGSLQNLKGDFGSVSGLIDNVSQNFPGRIGDLNKTIKALSKISGSYEKMISGFSGIKDLMNDISNIKNLSDLGGVLTGIGDIGADFSKAISGFQNIKGLLTGLGKFKDLAGLSKTLSSIKDLGGNITDLMSGFRDIKSVFDQLGNINNLSDLANAFDSISDLGGTFSDLLGKNGTVSQLLSSIKNLNLSGFGDFIGNFKDLGGDIKQLLSGFKNFGEFATKLAGIGNLTNAAGALSSLSNASGGLSTLLGSSGGMSGVLGKVAGVVTGGGLYVPVHETGQLLNLTGQLLTVNQTSDTNLGQSRDTLVKLCVHLKSIRRIQLAMEKQTFVTEPDMQRRAATKIEAYKQQILGPDGLIQTGGNSSGEITEPATDGQPGSDQANGAPLYVKNLDNYIDENRKGAAGILYDRLKQSSNIFKDEVGYNLKIKEDILKGNEIFTSTISKSAYDKFTTGDNSATPADEWWSTLTSIFNPERPNNPYTAYTLTKNRLDSDKARAEDLAMKEYSAGNGFLPTRKCVTYTSDGRFCIDQEIITPGTIIARTAGEALGTKLQQYLDPALGKIGEGNEPTALEPATFSPSVGAGGGREGGTGGGEQSVPAPMLVFSVSDKINSVREIQWITNSISSCTTDNDWLGTTNQNPLLSVIKRSGSTLSVSGNNNYLTFPLPFTFTPSWSKNGSPFSQTLISSTTNSVSTTYNWSIPQPGSSNDIYSLKISDGVNLNGVTISIGGATAPIIPTSAAQVVSMFRSYELNHSEAEIYKNYKFTYYTGLNAYIKIERIEPSYRISCTGIDGSNIVDSAKAN